MNAAPLSTVLAFAAVGAAILSWPAIFVLAILLALANELFLLFAAGPVAP